MVSFVDCFPAKISQPTNQLFMKKQLAAAQMPVALPQINQPVSSITRDTNEIKQDYANVYSVTEEPTVPLGQPERKRQAS